MTDIRVNPKTGEVIELVGNSWRPVEKSRVSVNKKSGELAVFDGSAWNVAGRVGPVAPPQIKTPMSGENIPSAFRLEPIQMTGQELQSPNDGLAAKVSGGGQRLANAMLLGGADEIVAGAKAAFSANPDQALQNNLANLELRGKQFGAENPKLATGLDVAGVIGSPLNLIGGEFVAAAPSVLGRSLRAAKVGGGMGGAAGFLSTEGGLSDRATGGAIGLGAGAALGLAGQPTMEAAGFGLKKAGEAGMGVVNAVRNQMQARANPQMQADKLIARSLLDDGRQLGFGPAPIDAPLPGQGLVNLGGENTTALARQATVAPGPTRTKAAEFFGEQAAGAPDRAADALTPLADKGYYGTAAELDKTRRAAAKPLYDLAYSKPAVEVWSPHIAELMKRPSMKAAFVKAQRIAAEEGRNPKELGLDFNEAGDPVFLAGADKNGQIPSTQTMDYIKRGLDDVVEAYRDKTTGKLVLDTEGRAINNTRAELVGKLREGNPDYAAALDAWGGPSQAIDMMDVGRQMFSSRGKPAESIMRFQKLTPAQQQLARIGFVRDAIEDLGTTGDSGSVYLKLFGNQNKRAVMETMFPDFKSFKAFADQMAAEKAMLGTNRTVMGGSPTARIEAEKATYDSASNVLGMADALRSGNPLRILSMALDRMRNLQRGVTPEVAEALGDRLFTMDPIEIQRLLSQVGMLRAPAPLTTLKPGATQFLRRTPFAPLVGYGSGQAGAAIATPQAAQVGR